MPSVAPSGDGPADVPTYDARQQPLRAATRRRDVPAEGAEAARGTQGHPVEIAGEHEPQTPPGQPPAQPPVPRAWLEAELEAMLGEAELNVMVVDSTAAGGAELGDSLPAAVGDEAASPVAENGQARAVERGGIREFPAPGCAAEDAELGDYLPAAVDDKAAGPVAENRQAEPMPPTARAVEEPPAARAVEGGSGGGGQAPMRRQRGMFRIPTTQGGIREFPAPGRRRNSEGRNRERRADSRDRSRAPRRSPGSSRGQPQEAVSPTQSPSQPSPAQTASPEATNARWGFEFRRSGLPGQQGQPGSAASGAAAPDPLGPLRVELGACANAEDLRAMLHPPKHFDGLRGEEDACVCRRMCGLAVGVL